MFANKKGFGGFSKFAQDAFKGTQEVLKASEQLGTKIAQKAMAQVSDGPSVIAQEQKTDVTISDISSFVTVTNLIDFF